MYSDTATSSNSHFNSKQWLIFILDLFAAFARMLRETCFKGNLLCFFKMDKVFRSIRLHSLPQSYRQLLMGTSLNFIFTTGLTFKLYTLNMIFSRSLSWMANTAWLYVLKKLRSFSELGGLTKSWHCSIVCKGPRDPSALLLG